MTTEDETPTPPDGATRGGSYRVAGSGQGWSARPGDQLAVLGDRLAVVLPGSETERAVALWPYVDAGAGLEEVLDALLAPGLCDLSDVVVVAREAGDRVTALVRGHRFRVEVTAEGAEIPLVVDATAARTWAERSFDDVAGVSIHAVATDAADARAESPPATWTGTGLLRVSSLAFSVTLGPALEVREAQRPARGEAADGPAEPPQPIRAPQEQEARDPGDAQDEPRARAVAVLAFADGTRVHVDEVVLVGRAPAPRGLQSGRPPRVVTVSSPQLAVSATHLEVRPGTGPDHGRAVVTDLGSTNGTVLAPPDRDPEELVPGVGAPLEPGAVIHLGDGVLFEVLRP